MSHLEHPHWHLDVRHPHQAVHLGRGGKQAGGHVPARGGCLDRWIVSVTKVIMVMTINVMRTRSMMIVGDRLIQEGTTCSRSDCGGKQDWRRYLRCGWLF